MQWLLRKCIKNYEHTEDPQVRTAYGVLSARVGIVCNLLLFGVKFLMGSVLRSMAVITDAFNNLSDAVSSVISLAAVRVAGKPADKDHPFGHGRLEYLAAFVIAALIVAIGVSFFRESVHKILHPSALSMRWYAVLFLALTVVVKLWLSSFNRNIGRAIQSDVMKATAIDAFFDAVTTGITLLSLAVYFLFHVNIDGAASLVVSFVVIWAGIGVARDVVRPLVGAPTDPELLAKIEDMVMEEEEISGVHDLVMHNYGPMRYMGSLHAELPKAMTLADAHEIIDRAERRVQTELGVSLVIHPDPVDLQDRRVRHIRHTLQRVVRHIDEDLSFHDLQVHFAEERTEIFFDLQVPFSYSEEQGHSAALRIASQMQKRDAAYDCIITIDRGAGGAGRGRGGER